MQPAFGMLMPPVSRYMTPHPCAVAPRDELSAARALMREYRIRHLPVLDDRELVGIVSDRDLATIHTPEDKVAGAMSCPVAAVPRETPIDEVLALMDARHVGSVVIVGKAGVEGIFTLTDVIWAFHDMLLRAEEGDR